MIESRAPVTSDVVDGVMTVRIDNPPVNALSAGVMAGLAAALAEADRDASVRAIVLTGGESFVAGADLTRLERIASGAPPEPVPAGGSLPELIARLERGRPPSVAAIDGFALGGGLELALGCHARVGTPRCRVGLPELRLGLIPGAGGTQRLPRVAGLAAATEIMLSSRHVPADEALTLGILDELAAPTELAARARAVALQIAQGQRPRRESLCRTDALGSADDAARLLGRARADADRRYGSAVEHPTACLDAIAFGLEHGAEAGLVRERELFRALLETETARSLIRAFFAARAAAKGARGR